METPHLEFEFVLPLTDLDRERVRHLTSYMGEAVRFATKSRDPSTQNGAVAVRFRRNYGMGDNFPGYNHLTGVQPQHEEDVYNQREKKLAFTIHAEEDAVLKAVWQPEPGGALAVVSPFAACSGCAKIMVACGVKYLLRDEWWMQRTPERWRTDVERADSILLNSGVIIATMDRGDNKIGTRLRFNGEVHDV